MGAYAHTHTHILAFVCGICGVFHTATAKKRRNKFKTHNERNNTNRKNETTKYERKPNKTKRKEKKRKKDQLQLQRKKIEMKHANAIRKSVGKRTAPIPKGLQFKKKKKNLLHSY